jgi:hypothetical protein
VLYMMLFVARLDAPQSALFVTSAGTGGNHVTEDLQSLSCPNYAFPLKASSAQKRAIWGFIVRLVSGSGR